MGDPGQWNKGRYYFNGEYWISDYTHTVKWDDEIALYMHLYY